MEYFRNTFSTLNIILIKPPKRTKNSKSISIKPFLKINKYKKIITSKGNFMNKHIEKIDINGDPNIGLYGFSTEKYTLIGYIDEEKQKTIKETLKTELINVRINNTNFIGIFAVGNSHGIIVPKITSETELKALKEKTKTRNIKISILNDIQTCLGNLITCNDYGCLASKTLEKHKEIIENTLKVPVIFSEFKESDMIGSYLIATNKGFLINMYVDEEDYNKAKEALKVDGDIGTVNFGSPFVKSGIMANTKGVIIGSQTTGPETVRIDEALGFLD